MLKKQILKIIGTISLISLVMVGCKPSGTPEERAERIVEHISDELDLKENQRILLDDSKDILLAKGKELAGIRKEITKELHQQFENDSIDEEKLNQLIDEKAEEVKAILKVFVSEMATFHATLDPEQKTEMLEHMKKMKKRHKRWGGHKHWWNDDDADLENEE